MSKHRGETCLLSFDILWCFVSSPAAGFSFANHHVEVSHWQNPPWYPKKRVQHKASQELQETRTFLEAVSGDSGCQSHSSAKTLTHAPRSMVFEDQQLQEKPSLAGLKPPPEPFLQRPKVRAQFHCVVVLRDFESGCRSTNKTR